MSERAALATIVRLKAEVEIDAQALDARALEATSLLAGEMDRAPLIVLAVNIHGYYTALETAFERIARLLDESLPSGPTWHADLVRQMSLEMTKLRPPVISSELLSDLHELRKFRHFFRNAYVLEFDPTQTIEQGRRIERIHPRVQASLRGFVEHLNATIEAITE